MVIPFKLIIPETYHLTYGAVSNDCHDAKD